MHVRAVSQVIVKEVLKCASILRPVLLANQETANEGSPIVSKVRLAKIVSLESVSKVLQSALIPRLVSNVNQETAEEDLSIASKYKNAKIVRLRTARIA